MLVVTFERGSHDDAGGDEMKRFAFMWAIIGRHGFYIGTWYRRVDAIGEHCWSRNAKLPRYQVSGKLSAAQKAEWAICTKLGDRCVRVRVTEI